MNKAVLNLLFIGSLYALGSSSYGQTDTRSVQDLDNSKPEKLATLVTLPAQKNWVCHQGQCQQKGLEDNRAAAGVSSQALSTLISEALPDSVPSCDVTSASLSSSLSNTENDLLNKKEFVSCSLSKSDSIVENIEEYDVPFDKLPNHLQSLVNKVFPQRAQNKFIAENRFLKVSVPMAKVNQPLKSGESSFRLGTYNDHFRGVSDIVLSVVGRENRGTDEFHTAGLGFHYAKNLSSIGRDDLQVSFGLDMNLYTLYILPENLTKNTSGSQLPEGFVPLDNNQKEKFTFGNKQPGKPSSGNEAASKHFNDQLSFSAQIRQELEKGKYKKYSFQLTENNFDHERRLGLLNAQGQAHNALGINEGDLKLIKNPHLSNRKLQLAMARGVTRCFSLGNYVVVSNGEVSLSGQRNIGGNEKDNSIGLQLGFKGGISASKLLKGGTELNLGLNAEVIFHNLNYGQTYGVDLINNNIFMQEPGFGHGAKLSLGAKARTSGGHQLALDVIYKYGMLPNSEYLNLVDEGVPNINLSYQKYFGTDSKESEILSPYIPISKRTSGAPSAPNFDKTQVVRVQIAQ